MQFNDYQTAALTTAKYPAIGHLCIYPALGLANEAGEVLGKIKKVFRDDGGTFTEEKLAAISDELGDVLWYVAGLAHELGFKLDDIATHNLHKLKSRKERNAICGDGDTR